MSILDSGKMSKKAFGIIHFNRFQASVFLQDTHTPVIISHQSEPKPRRKFFASSRRQWSRLVGCYPRSLQLEARIHHCWKLLLVTFTHLSLSLSLWGSAPCRLTLLALDGSWSLLLLLITMSSMFAHAKCYVTCWWLLVYYGNCSVLFVTTPTNSHIDILYGWTLSFLSCIPPIKHLKYLPTPITVRRFPWTLVCELVPKSSPSL